VQVHALFMFANFEKSVVLLVIFNEMLCMKPSMRALNKNVIQEVAPHYYDIGLELGIEPVQLRIIKTDNPNQCCQKCQLMFEKFLGSGSATWKAVIEALRFSAAQLLNLAERIEVDLPG